MSNAIADGKLELVFVFLADQLSQRVAELEAGETTTKKLDVENFTWAISTLRERLGRG